MVTRKLQAGGSRQDPAKSLASLAKRRKANMSRKEVTRIATAKKRARNVTKQAKQIVQDRKQRAENVKAKNRKVKRVLDRDQQRAVAAGVVEAIQSMGGNVSPISVFAAAATAILQDNPATKSQAPYLLNVIGASLRHLSPNLVVSKLQLIVQVVSRVLTDFSASDHTTAAKAFRLLSDFAIKAVSGPLIRALEAAADSQTNDEATSRAVLDTLPTLVQRAMAAMKAVEPSKLNAVIAPLYYSCLRKFYVQLFNLDEHNKVLFGISTSMDAADDEWEDIDEEGSTEKPRGTTTAPSDLCSEFLWALRHQLMSVLGDVTGTLLSGMCQRQAAVTKSALENVSEILTLTFARCCVEFAGFVLRPGGSVEANQLALLTGVIDPVIVQITDTFRDASADRAQWMASLDLVTRVYSASKLGILKRSAYAESALRLSQQVGVPPPLHHKKRGGAANEDDFVQLVQRDDSHSAHHQKALPSVLQVAPSTGLLVRVLDKLRGNDDTELQHRCDEALVAIGNCCTMRGFMELLPFDPHTDTTSRDVWRRSYLLHSVWKRIAHHDSLTFFAEVFIPRLQTCEERIVQLRGEETTHELQQFEALHDQYWRLCAAFFSFPVEFDEVAFRNIARKIVALLPADGSPLSAAAHAGCAALENLCNSMYDLACQNDAFDDSDDDDEEPTEENAGDALLARDDDVLHPHLHHFVPQAQALRVCALISKYSKNIMPRLCNAAESYEGASGTRILSAVASFAKVCAPTVMHSVLTSILQVGENISAGVGVVEKGLSNQRRVVLDIAVGIVPQLDESFLPGLVQVAISSINPSDGQVSAALQKKGYRLLLNLFEHRLAEIAAGLEGIISAITNGREHATAPAMKLRLRCLSWTLDACKIYAPEHLIDYGMGLVDEVMLCTRERSAETRQRAMEWFEKYLRYCTGHNGTTGEPAVRTLLFRVLAGLAGKTPLSISAAVLVASKIVRNASNDQVISPDDIRRISSMIFGLADHAATEVRNSAVIYARMLLNLMPKSAKVRSSLSEVSAGELLEVTATSPLVALLRAVAVTVSQAHVTSSTRMEMRHLLERILERFTQASVERFFPPGSIRFLHYVAKQKRRVEKNKLRDEDRTEERKIVAWLSGDEHRAAARDEDDAIDLLGEAGASRLVAASTAKAARTNKGGDEEDASDPYVMRFDQDGKLEIMSRVARQSRDDAERRQQTAEKLLRQAAATRRTGRAGALQGPSIAAAEVNADNKRRRTAETEDFENEELMRAHGGVLEPSAKPSQGTQRDRERALDARALKRNRGEEDIKKGTEFASKTGLGDVKKGNVEPFAYVPLSRAMLNKRNTAQRVNRFKAVDYRGLKGRKAVQASAMQKANQNE
jgi:ribosomal RNA-processing protein 12